MCLEPTSPDAARIDLLLQFTLAVAAEQDDFRDRELGAIHLLKYVYLADVAHAEQTQGVPFSGARWLFHHFGPWSFEVFERIEPALAVVHAEPKRFSSRYGDDVVRYRMDRVDAQRIRERAERALPGAVQFCIARAVRDFGPDTASLLRCVYQTAPMLNAAPEESLDFNSLVREPAAEYSADSGTSPRAVKGRRSKRRLNEMRAEVQARLANATAGGGRTAAEPRYDDVFAAGVKWLDGLAGEPVPETEGKLSIADDIWKSDTRRDPEVP